MAVLTYENIRDHSFVKKILTPNVYRRIKDYSIKSIEKLENLRIMYEEIFNDNENFLKSRKYINELTRDNENNPKRLEIRSSRLRMLNGDDPLSEMDEVVSWILLTRKERWERMAHKLDIPFPDTFRVFRGVTGLEAVEDVMEYWNKSDGKDLFPVRQYSTASWSLNSDSARVFMKDKAVEPNAVLYSAEIDFELTFADILLDDGSFIVPYQSQWEVVVGPLSEEDAVFAEKSSTIVRFLGVEYGFSEKDLLNERYSEFLQSGNLVAGGAS